jgi:hypothetical protein
VNYDYTISRREIPEQIVEGKRLGRHVNHDSRSLNYVVEAGAVSSVVHKPVGLPLDQGHIGSCTANATVGAGNCPPSRHVKSPYTEIGAVRLYERETRDEGQPYPPNDPGGSGLAVCQAAKELGWIKSYSHALSVPAALTALQSQPVITGVPWYEGFDKPDQNGLVQISGQIRGGHEIVVVGVDVPGKLVWLVNSWGLKYGVASSTLGLAGGCFCWSWDTWDQLLANQGDVTVPVF